MNIVVVGLSHKTAPVELREKLFFPDELLGEALYRLTHLPAVEEGVILSTCNRVEVWTVVKNTECGREEIAGFLREHNPSVPPDILASHLYFYTAKDAIRHLFRVASSLDSMIVGEPQILGQLKDAFESAKIHKGTGLILNRLFGKAISVAKRVRTETKIAECPVSVSSAAVELAQKIFGRLHEKIVLLVGSGEMAELASRHLITHGVRQILVTNRSYERAVNLAKEFDGVPLRFDELFKAMVDVDIVLCSTAADECIIRYAEVEHLIHLRRNRPVFLIDISVPRNIDPTINEIDNVFLYDIDDLRLVVEANLKERRQEAILAEAIISDEVETASRWLKSLDVVPTIVAIREKAEEIRRSELEKLFTRWRDMTQAQRECIEGVTISIIKKLLHAPLVALKEESHSTNGSMYIEAARRLFNLEEGPPPSPDRKEEEKEK